MKSVTNIMESQVNLFFVSTWMICRHLGVRVNVLQICLHLMPTIELVLEDFPFNGFICHFHYCWESFEFFFFVSIKNSQKLLVNLSLIGRVCYCLPRLSTDKLEYFVQVFYFLDWVKHLLNDSKLFQAFLRITVTTAVGVGAVAMGVGTASGYISPWTGRFYSLLDPTYAKDHIPIIASVSEHQPTAWSSFMFDFHILLFLFPAGLYFCFKRLSDATIFIVMYGLTSMYFAGVMVRLILVATPAVCLISAIAVSATIKNLTLLVRAKSKVANPGAGKGASSAKASSKVMFITPNFKVTSFVIALQ